MPVYLRGRMRPWSVTYCLSRVMFLKSSASSVKSIFGFGRGVRFSDERRLPRLSFSVLVLRGIITLSPFARGGGVAPGCIFFPPAFSISVFFFGLGGYAEGALRSLC